MNHNRPIRTITENLIKIINFTDETNDARTRLSKIILSNASTGWSATLSLILERYHRDERSFGFDPKQVFFAFRAAHENPALAIAFEKLGTSESYLGLLRKGSRGSPFVSLCTAVATNTGWDDIELGRVPHWRITKSRASAALRIGDPIDAVKLIVPMYDEGDSPLRSELGQAAVEALLRCGELLRCSDICVELFQTSHSFATSLPLDRVLNAITVAANAGPIDVG